MDLQKSTIPIILANSSPFLFISTEVGTPLKDSSLARELSLRGVPTSVLINKNGEEFARIIGIVDF